MAVVDRERWSKCLLCEVHQQFFATTAQDCFRAWGDQMIVWLFGVICNFDGLAVFGKLLFTRSFTETTCSTAIWYAYMYQKMTFRNDCKQTHVKQILFVVHWNVLNNVTAMQVAFESVCVAKTCYEVDNHWEKFCMFDTIKQSVVLKLCNPCKKFSV